MAVGQRIKAARKAAGLTQAVLARMANVSRSYVGGIEIGTYNPSLVTLQLIAKALNVSVGSLVGDDPCYENHLWELETEESQLINDYRGLTDDDKITVKNLVSRLSQSSADKKRSSKSRIISQYRQRVKAHG